MISLVAT